MKKMNYVRPLAEVVELEAQDIITTSDFWQNTDSAEGSGNQIESGYVKFGVDDGKIKVGDFN